MLDTIEYYSSVAARFIKISIQSMLEYPMGLIGWLLANPIQFLFGIATLKFVLQEFGTLNGWNFGEVAFLYGLAVISHGLSVVLFIQTWNMGSSILNGEFDIFMLRPMNVLFQFMFMFFNLIGFTDMIPGLVVFIYGCSQVHFQWTFVNIIALILAIAGATLIRGALFTITGSIAFWSKSNNQFVGINLTILEKTCMYPLSMYPRMLQIIFTFIIPLGFVTFYPASYFLGKKNSFMLPIEIGWASIGVGIVCFIIASYVFNRGLKNYESSGT